MSLRVLLIDDEPTSIETLSARLHAPHSRFRPLALTVVRTWTAAKVRIVLEAYDAIVVRQCLSDATALGVLDALHGLPHPPVVVLMPEDDLDTALRLLRAGAEDCVMTHLAEWQVDLDLAIGRVAGAARRRHGSADAPSDLNEHSAVLAALLLRRQTPAFGGWSGRC